MFFKRKNKGDAGDNGAEQNIRRSESEGFNVQNDDDNTRGESGAANFAAREAAETPEVKKSDLLAPATAALDKELRKEFEDFKIRKVLHRIDSACLGIDVTRETLKKVCKDAEKYGFYSVVVSPVNVPAAADYLGEDSKVKISSTVSYPLGEDTVKVKVFQAKQAVLSGADEIDMVACISAIKRGDYRYYKKEINKVAKAVKRTPVKVIIETSALTSGEIEKAAKFAAETKATFIETCTGFYGEGAKESDVRSMRRAAGSEISVKANGGINNCHDCMAMLEAGADRIGTENAEAIAEGLLKGECK